ncbi:MAG TPA: helix-turn-helix transcriptional regulator [Paenibacillus sp.]
MSTGLRIKLLRAKKGLTQDQMAEQLDMNRANFSNYERNKAVPPGETLMKIAKILNTTTDYLLGGSDNPNRIPEWATPKDMKDFKEMLEEDGDLMFDGIPLNHDDKQKIKDVLTGLFWEAKQMNKEALKKGKQKRQNNE